MSGGHCAHSDAGPNYHFWGAPDPAGVRQAALECSSKQAQDHKCVNGRCGVPAICIPNSPIHRHHQCPTRRSPCCLFADRLTMNGVGALTLAGLLPKEQLKCEYFYCRDNLLSTVEGLGPAQHLTQLKFLDLAEPLHFCLSFDSSRVLVYRPQGSPFLPRTLDPYT